MLGLSSATEISVSIEALLAILALLFTGAAAFFAMRADLKALQKTERATEAALAGLELKIDGDRRLVRLAAVEVQDRIRELEAWANRERGRQSRGRRGAGDSLA